MQPFQTSYSNFDKHSLNYVLKQNKHQLDHKKKQNIFTGKPKDASSVSSSCATFNLVATVFKMVSSTSTIKSKTLWCVAENQIFNVET